MEVSGLLHAPTFLPAGKEPLVPIGKEVGWDPEPFHIILFLKVLICLVIYTQSNQPLPLHAKKLKLVSE